MPEKAAQFNITEVNETLSIGQISSNVSGVLIDAEMGPIGDAETLITSDLQFRRVYGGVRPDKSNQVSYNNAIRALQRGSSLRVCNVKHYADIDDKASLSADYSLPQSNKIFTLSAPMVAGQFLRLTFGLGETLNQPFVTSSDHTIDLLFKTIKVSKGVKKYANILYTGRRVIANSFTLISDNDVILNPSFSVVGTSVPTVAVTTYNSIKNSIGEVLFSFTPKYPGIKYDDLNIFVTPNVKGGSYFDVIITLANSEIAPEVYRGIIINNYTEGLFLENIRKQSQLVVPVYPNTVLTAPAIPVESMLKYRDGTDGDAIVEADIVGNSVSKTGVYAFDGFDDVARIANLVGYETMDPTLIEPYLSGYADARKDLIHFALLYGTDITLVVAMRNSLGIDSSYSRIYADGLGLIVPKSDNLNDINYEHSLGDILGAAAYSAGKYFPWLSYAGENRGVLINNIGVGNQWGASQADLDYFAQNQINTVISRNKKRCIWGNFTAQVQEDLLSYNSIRDLMIYMKKALIPLAGVFLEEPNDIPTWRSIYQKVRPWIIQLEDKRAIFEGRWYGDQDASTLDDLKINSKTDVQNGKYRAKFLFKPINSLQDFGINLVLTPSSASFEEILPISNLNN